MQERQVCVFGGCDVPTPIVSDVHRGCVIAGSGIEQLGESSEPRAQLAVVVHCPRAGVACGNRRLWQGGFLAGAVWYGAGESGGWWWCLLDGLGLGIRSISVSRHRLEVEPQLGQHYRCRHRTPPWCSREQKLRRDSGCI